MAYSISIDIGGTKINTGIIKNNRVFKNHIYQKKWPKTLNNFLAIIKKELTIFQPQQAKNIGISFPGPINEKGVIRQATNLPNYIKNVNLKKIIETWFKKPVFLEHDGFCFTLAESTIGAGRKYKYVVGLTLGTGVGGGFAVDKKIYLGSKRLMEIGHFKITERGFKCSCGKYGHFESQVSGPALTKYFKGISGKNISGVEIHRLAKKGDKKALKTAQKMAKYLGIALANIINTLSPEIIVIGGGVSNFSEVIKFAIPEAKKEVIYPGHKNIKIVKSKLNNDALLIGAHLITKSNYILT